MLDLNHPQTEHIFAAARLEDAILDVANRIISAQPSDRDRLLKQCEWLLDGMRTLNTEHFRNSHSIASAIDELQVALRVLAESASPRMEIVSSAFSKLESEEGFRTCAI